MANTEIKSVMFCCTGNVFRSLTAEYALRRELARRAAPLVVSSAGTSDLPQLVRPSVRNYLQHHGLDVTAHARRTLTRALLNESDLTVAMSLDHQSLISAQFRRDVPLFLELCASALAGSHALPDVDEAVPDFQTNKLAAQQHIHMTIDRIIQVMPKLAERLCAGELDLFRAH